MASKDKEKEAEEEAGVKDISDSKVLDKYKAASEICNKALELIISQLTDGALVHAVCQAGDQFILEATSKLYNKPKLPKGIAFPTCLSVNHVVGHFSPLADNKDAVKTGDLVKIDLGVQIDGYAAVAAHTVVVGGGEITGRRADCTMAAWNAAEVALRLLKPGKKNVDITKAVGEVAKAYGVNAVAGVVSHEISQNVIDGANVILMREDVEQKVKDVEFQANQVWAIDIVMSTGEGKPIEREAKTTIYKRDPEKVYQLKLKASKTAFSTIKKEHPYFPFNITHLDAKSSGMALRECVDHGLLAPYPVLFEKEGEHIVHIKYTALITQNGVQKITGLPVNTDLVKADKTLENEELVALLKTSAGKKKKKNKKKK